MAYRAGARVINMEFVQFHPTTFYHPSAPRFLITEAVRGDGGRLVNAAGEPFMQNYDAEWKDLAPRDVVSRSIYHEMLTHDVTNVYLDLRSTIPEARIREHFPNIYQKCLAYGIDLTRDLVPVVPGAHYSCGGVWVDEWGLSTIDRLVCHRRSGLHRPARRESTGQHVIARRIGVGQAGGAAHRAAASRSIRARSRSHSRRGSTSAMKCPTPR